MGQEGHNMFASEKNRVTHPGAEHRFAKRRRVRLFHETGREVVVTFVTAPVLRDQVDVGSACADVVFAPIARMDAFEAAENIVQGTRTILGSVKAGLVVRKEAPE